MKVGEALDIAPDGTLSAKTLNDKIAAAVAVKSEPRLVWNHYEETGKRWKTYDIKMPDGLDYVHVKTKYNSSTGGYGEEVDIAKGAPPIITTEMALEFSHPTRLSRQTGPCTLQQNRRPAATP